MLLLIFLFLYDLHSSYVTLSSPSTLYFYSHYCCCAYCYNYPYTYECNGCCYYCLLYLNAPRIPPDLFSLLRGRADNGPAAQRPWSLRPRVCPAVLCLGRPNSYYMAAVNLSILSTRSLDFSITIKLSLSRWSYHINPIMLFPSESFLSSLAYQDIPVMLFLASSPIMLFPAESFLSGYAYEVIPIMLFLTSYLR